MSNSNLAAKHDSSDDLTEHAAYTPGSAHIGLTPEDLASKVFWITVIYAVAFIVAVVLVVY